jgi:hypothetical protein
MLSFPRKRYKFNFASVLSGLSNKSLSSDLSVPY